MFAELVQSSASRLLSLSSPVLQCLSKERLLGVQFALLHRKRMHLHPPLTFSEKIQFRKLFEKDPDFSLYSDKVRVKELVHNTLGSEWVIPTLWSGTTLPEKPPGPFPLVLKSNHASGWNYFLRAPENWNLERLRPRVRNWLATDWHPRLVEDFYNEIPRQLLIEPMLGDPSKSLTDYKFFVFGGRVCYVQVDTNRNSNHKRVFFNRNWTRQTFSLMYPLETAPVPAPRHLSEMIFAAETLAAKFSFARVDLYDLDDHPRFGEMTFCPGSGFERFNPEESDLALGSLWHLGQG